MIANCVIIFRQCGSMFLAGGHVFLQLIACLVLNVPVSSFVFEKKRQIIFRYVRVLFFIRDKRCILSWIIRCIFKLNMCIHKVMTTVLTASVAQLIRATQSQKYARMP